MLLAIQIFRYRFRQSMLPSSVYRSSAMANNNPQNKDQGAIKDPGEWVTGGEPMTGAQDSYVHTLAREAGEEVPEDMTKAEASEKIEELQEQTGRGRSSGGKSVSNGRRRKRS
jgi:hypothetical protein